MVVPEEGVGMMMMIRYGTVRAWRGECCATYLLRAPSAPIDDFLVWLTADGNSHTSPQPPARSRGKNPMLGFGDTSVK